MKLCNLLLVLLASILSFSAQASVDGDGYDDATIRASDIPTDAPSFAAYPTKLYVGPNAKLLIADDPEIGRASCRERV